MRVEVNEELCQGHTLCTMHASDVFDIHDDTGQALVKLDGEIPTELQQGVRDAVVDCPEHALTIIE
jgi:ferredoxin